MANYSNTYQDEENLGQVLWEFLPGVLKFLSFIGLIGILIIGGQAFLQATDTLEEYTFEPDLIRPYTPVFGNSDSELTVFVVSDFQCVACASYDSGFREVEEEYKDRIQFGHKHYPMENLHPYAEEAVWAAQAAHAQGYYLEYADLVFANQRLLSTEGVEALEIWAEQIEGLDIDQWNVDRNSLEVQRQVRFSQQDIDEIALPTEKNSFGRPGKAAGEGTGTPTTIIMRGEEVAAWWTGAADAAFIREEIEKQLN